MLERNIIDQLHDQHRLAHAGTAEEAGLATLEVGLEQIDDISIFIRFAHDLGQVQASPAQHCGGTYQWEADQGRRVITFDAFKQNNAK